MLPGNHTGAKLQLQNVSKFGANFHIDVDHAGSLTDSNPCSNHLCDYKREINVFQMYPTGSKRSGNGINFHGGRSDPVKIARDFHAGRAAKQSTHISVHRNILHRNTHHEAKNPWYMYVGSGKRVSLPK